MANNRLTRSYIEHTVDTIAKVNSLSLEVDWTSGRPRVASTTGGGYREISPRLSISQMELWLRGFEEGLFLAQARK